MISEKTMEIIKQSPNKDIYEMFMECDKTGERYLRAVDIVVFLNSIHKEMIDLNIVNEIFAEVVTEIMMIGGNAHGR